MSENGEIYTAGKNFTLPPALTALTNSTSGGSTDLGNIPKRNNFFTASLITHHSSEVLQADWSWEKSK